MRTSRKIDLGVSTAILLGSTALIAPSVIPMATAFGISCISDTLVEMLYVKNAENTFELAKRQVLKADTDKEAAKKGTARGVAIDLIAARTVSENKDDYKAIKDLQARFAIICFEQLYRDLDAAKESDKEIIKDKIAIFKHHLGKTATIPDNNIRALISAKQNYEVAIWRSDKISRLMSAGLFTASFVSFAAPIANFASSLSNPNAAMLVAYIGAETIGKAFAIGVIPFISLATIGIIKNYFNSDDKSEDKQAEPLCPIFKLYFCQFFAQMLKYYLSPANFAVNAASIGQQFMAGGLAYFTFNALYSFGRASLDSYLTETTLGGCNYTAYAFIDVLFPNIGLVSYNGPAGLIEATEGAARDSINEVNGFVKQLEKAREEAAKTPVKTMKID